MNISYSSIMSAIACVCIVCIDAFVIFQIKELIVKRLKSQFIKDIMTLIAIIVSAFSSIYLVLMFLCSLQLIA